MAKIKLDKSDVEIIKYLLENTNIYHRQIAEMFGITRGHVTKIKNNKRWNYEYGQSGNTNADEIVRIINLRREAKEL